MHCNPAITIVSYFMSEPNKIRIPRSAIEELDQVGEMDWGDGISLDELLGWINQVVDRFRPDGPGDGRASAAFTPRSFRHYQTLGCIDSPSRQGKGVVYGFRHYMQGLVVRKLLWERLPSERIADLMADKNNAALRRLLLEDIEAVSVGSHEEAVQGNSMSSDGTWTRETVSPGVEIHLNSKRRRLNEKEIAGVLRRIRGVL